MITELLGRKAHLRADDGVIGTTEFTVQAVYLAHGRLCLALSDDDGDLYERYAVQVRIID